MTALVLPFRPLARTGGPKKSAPPVEALSWRDIVHSACPFNPHPTPEVERARHHGR